MGYQLQCDSCHVTWGAKNIIDLIELHTDNKFGRDGGYLRCSACGGQAYEHRVKSLQEKGQTWEHYVVGVVRLSADEPAYNPYVLLTKQQLDLPVDGFHFGYYKDTTAEGGRLKHGHGPGGPPVLGQDQLLLLLQRLLALGCLPKVRTLEVVTD